MLLDPVLSSLMIIFKLFVTLIDFFVKQTKLIFMQSFNILIEFNLFSKICLKFRRLIAEKYIVKEVI